MTNSNVYASNVASNSIDKLAGALASIGFNADQISTVCNFCRDAAEVDRRYREANGGGRVMPPASYSRRGKEHREVRGADYFAVAIRKEVWKQFKNNPKPKHFSILFTVDKEGALYSECAGRVYRYERTYNFAFSKVEVPTVVEVSNANSRLWVSTLGVTSYKY